MEPRLYITMMTLASIGFIILRFMIRGRKDIFTYAILFYFYFTFGPVINYLIGLPIYFGTPIEYISTAVNIFTLAIFSMCATSLISARKDEVSLGPATTNYSVVIPIMLFFSIYAILQSIYILFFAMDGTKIDKIALLIPKIHYNYLLLQIYLVSFYFLMTSKIQRRIYWFNFCSYITYCIITSERDFIFPLAAISLHTLVFTKLSRRKKILLIGGVLSLFILATAIFIIRDITQGDTSALGSMLNQGSLLFINSYTAKLLDDSYDFFNGFTYLNSIQNLLPSWIYKTDFNTLDWFKNNYAPNSDSGYGFGLDAEGYMNFGYIGVVLTFVYVTFIQVLIIRNINRHDFFKYYSVFYICFIMYTFRNDSLAFMKGNLYAIIFFMLMMVSSKIINGKLAYERNSNT